MNARFSGKLVLIAGGTGALGSAVSAMFLGEGAKVVVTYREQGEYDDLTRTAGADAASLQGQRIDVADPTAVDGLVQGVLAEHGHLDVLVNTIGAYAGGMKLWETEPKVFDRMLTLNLRSGYTLFRAVVPAMLKQKRGAMVNIASKAAVDHAAGAGAALQPHASGPADMPQFGR